MKKKWMLLLFCSIILSACTASLYNFSINAPFNLNHTIAVIPFANNTETPLAGERAMSITASIMETHKPCQLIVYQPTSSKENVLFPGMSQSQSQHALMQWAKKKRARYALTGSVNEWTYKVGLDGEPVVGLTLQLIDLQTGRIVWAGVGSQSGGSRVAVSTIAQRVIDTLIRLLYQAHEAHPKQMKQ